MPSRARAWGQLLVGLLLGLWLSQPGIVQACSVCFSAKNKENQIAYLATTGFLTFLPLGLIGGLLLWIRRRSRELEAEPPSVAPGEGRLEAVRRQD